MKYLLFIALGGAGGAVSRYLLANRVHGMWEARLPVGTLGVNVLGSFAIGVIYVDNKVKAGIFRKRLTAKPE